jgi:protein-tyrosine-phosphatase
MKITAYLLLAFVVITAVISSGCLQQTNPSSSGGQELTQSQMDDQALQAVQAEMDNSIDQMTADQIEAELLNQG